MAWLSLGCLALVGCIHRGCSAPLYRLLRQQARQAAACKHQAMLHIQAAITHELQASLWPKNCTFQLESVAMWGGTRTLQHSIHNIENNCLKTRLPVLRIEV